MPSKKPYRRRHLTGLTLIEIMLAILVLMVVVIGTSGYRYYSAMDARRAIKHETAARIASLLNESWRGAMDANLPFNPVTHLAGAGLAIATAGNGPTKPADFALLNNAESHYKVAANNANYFITMSYKLVTLPATGNPDPHSAPHRLIALNIIVAWPITASEITYSASDCREFILTTYVEKRPD